jgi:hypothetical protein
MKVQRFMPNPQRAKGEPVNLTAGNDMGKKNARSVKTGAGSRFGPTIAPGFLVSGTGGTKATGGKFAGANKAKMTKGSTKRG